MKTRKPRKTSTELKTTRDGIIFDRETGDFAVYANGQLLGYRASYPEAESLQRGA